MEPAGIAVGVRVEEVFVRLDLVESRMSHMEESVTKAINTLLPKVDALLTRSNEQAATSVPCTSLTFAAASPSLVEMAEQGDYEALLGLLTDTEIDIQRNPQRTENGDTALHVAACGGHLKTVMVLLGAGAKVNAAGHRLRTALHCAAAHGHVPLARRLLFAGAQVDAKDADGATPLGLAAGQGNRDLVNLLLQKGAHPNDKAVSIAAENGNWNLVELFLHNGGAFVNVCNKEGESLIVLAAKANRWEMVDLLLEKGASATKCKLAKECALVWASQAGQADSVRELLRRGAASSVEQVQWALGQAKSAAVVWAFADVVPDKVRGPCGEYCLREATIHGRLEPLVTFLEAGVNINAINSNNSNALFFAAANGRLACVRELLNRGADFNTKTYLGNTPLHVATSSGHVECVCALLAAGASTTERNNEGKTPLDVAPSDEIRLLLNGQS